MIFSFLNKQKLIMRKFELYYLKNLIFKKYIFEFTITVWIFIVWKYLILIKILKEQDNYISLIKICDNFFIFVFKKFNI